MTTNSTTQSATLNRLHYIRALYDWTLKWAVHKWNIYALGFLSAIESIFFPIPVDPLLMAMCLSRPQKSLLYSTVTILTSVAGALGGYAIGALLWYATKDFFIGYVFSQEIFDLAVAKYNENAFLAIFVSSFTPLPFKVFTVSSGVAEIPIMTLILAALVGRGARFYLLGGLIYFFGEPIKNFIDKYFNMLVVAFAILGVGGYFLVPVFLK